MDSKQSDEEMAMDTPVIPVEAVTVDMLAGATAHGEDEQKNATEKAELYDEEGAVEMPGGGSLTSASALARPVATLPLVIQRGFRWKLLVLLLLQLAFTTSLAAALRWGCPEQLDSVFKPQSAQSIALFVVVAVSLPALALVKDKHPWNLLFTVLWSILFAVFVAASDLPDSFFLSHALFQIMLQLTAGVALLTIFSQCVTGNNLDGPILWSFSTAGLVSWLLYVVIAIVIYVTCLRDVSSVGHFITSTIISTLVFVWICYDASQLCKKMSPDEYMKGVIHFYTDLFFVCLCCAFLSCMGSTPDAH